MQWWFSAAGYAMWNKSTSRQDVTSIFDLAVRPMLSNLDHGAWALRVMPMVNCYRHRLTVHHLTLEAQYDVMKPMTSEEEKEKTEGTHASIENESNMRC
ncbi:hypothetical protein RRF57_000044 [Xylaria bambusicola]|uniref:Uncharacterized protein n=1 Tax=Xylaria bambusicola TaxID=326684 RepID=A0AAN7U9J6_9PEZI